MIKRFIIFSIISFTAIFLSSCTGAKDDSIELKQIPIKEIKERVNQNFELIESLEASGSISFDSPEMSSSGSIDVKIRKPDTVYVNIEGPFGISVASALITRKDFIYYNAQENVSITGQTTENNIDAILRIKISFDELINSFSGSFYFLQDTADSIDAVSEDNTYVLQSVNNIITKRYFIEPASFTLNKYKVSNAQGSTLLEVSYSKYNKESVSGIVINFPNQIVINKPDKKQTVWLDYDSKTINKKDIRFKIKVPKSAKLIKWE
jgi:outer membrane lipoprotein-sorting protein